MTKRRILSLTILAAGLAVTTMSSAANAQRVVQTYNDPAAYQQQPEPLYPYAVQPSPYVAAPRAYPYVRNGYVQKNTASVIRPKKAAIAARANINDDDDDELPAKSAGSPRILKRAGNVNASFGGKAKGKTDPALVEELKKRAEKDPVINKTIVVREKPIVVEHKRIVDDPPVVVTREHVIDEYHVERPRGLIRGGDKAQDAPAPIATPAPAPLPPAGGQRVIRAEAEVTILGPDRMSIRLFRKAGQPAPPELAND